MSDFPLSPFGDPSWLLIEERDGLAREHEIESILTTANGYLGTKASIGNDSRFSHPATFAAGVYVTDGELGPRLAVLPNWLNVEVTVEDHQLSLEVGRTLEHRRLLDLRQANLWREWRQQDRNGRITRLNYCNLLLLLTGMSFSIRCGSRPRTTQER